MNRLWQLVSALLFFAFLVWAGSIWVSEMAEKNQAECTRFERMQAETVGVPCQPKEHGVGQ